MSNKTIMIPVNQGFAFRYLCQTDIFQTLQASGNRLVILLPHPQESFYDPYRQYENVVLAPYRMQEYSDYAQARLERFLSTIRLFTQNGKYNIRTVKDHFDIFLQDNREYFQQSGWFTGVLTKGGVFAARRFTFVRKLILWIEHTFFTPHTHKDLFEKYQPHMLIVPSLGTFDYDQFLMREATHFGIPVTSIILSWDNTTTRGMPGAIPDHVVAWTENMRQELIQLNDIEEGKIFVGGVAHFDHYYRQESFLSKEQFCEQLGVDPNKKLLFFVTKSPNGYAWNTDIAEIILKAMQTNQLDEPCQLLVRLHPLYYRQTAGKFLFQNFLDKFLILKKEYPTLILNAPQILSENMNYAMPESEIILLASILKYSDVVINMYSTLNIEATIFDVPIVNVSFEGTSDHGKLNSRHNIVLDEWQSHNQRVVQSGGIQMVRDGQELIAALNEALLHPDSKQEARIQLRQAECEPYPGKAGNTIAHHVLELLQ